MSAAFSKIDKAVKCKVLHRNNGARKSNLANGLYQKKLSIIPVINALLGVPF